MLSRRVLVDIKIQASQLDIFIVEPHLLDEFLVIVDDWLEDLYLVFGDIFFEGLHVEVVEMGKVVVKFAHLFDCVTQVVGL